MDAGKRDITTIFNRARTLEIPFFQRSYVWEKGNWERFADDLIAVGQQRAPYFLGSIILKQKDTSTHAAIGDVRAVVDGQQRLTSLVLFFRVLCDTAGAKDLFRDVFVNLQGKLILQHNHNDIEVFEAVAAGDRLAPDLRTRYAQNGVLRAYDYFRRRKNEIGAVDPMVLLSYLYFVGIDLGKDEDEQQIFDTINSLGVDLTTAELLKNTLYDRSDLDLFKTTWRRSFESSEPLKHYWSMQVTSGRARRQNIDLFLQAHLLNQPGISDDVRVGNLFSEYKEHLADNVSDRTSFIHQLTQTADVYREHVDPHLLNQAIDPGSPYERLNLIVFGLQTTTVLPYYLRILRDVHDADERARMLRLLETYLMRRLVSGETTKHYNRFFAGLARASVSSFAGLVTHITRSEDVSTRLPTDEAVREGFQQTNLTNQQARVVLYLIEASIRDDTRHSTALAGFKHYTLEHVMPKNWIRKWGPVPEDHIEVRNRLVRKLGNLTLLSARLNKSIRDADWKTKKEGSGEKGGLKRYGVGLEIFDQDLQEDEWTEDHITARGDRLAVSALSPTVWPWPDVER